MAVALDLSSVTLELNAEIKKVCTLKPSATQYNNDPEPVTCFAVNSKENAIYVPLGAWRHFLDEFPERNYSKTKVEFKKVLYTLGTDPKGTRDQDVIVEEATQKLNIDHTVFIAVFTGGGKTTIGNYFTSHFKLKTAIICHLDTVNEQWVEEFEKYSTAKVQRVKGTSILDPTADVYIFGVHKAAKMPRKALVDIGLVIFDEAHVATITAFTTTLLRFQPKYVIGLSATPKRSDGMHKMLTMYFGPRKGFIVREEVKDFTVYKVETPYEPTIRYNVFQGQSTLDWTTLINSIAYNEQRQDYIVSLVLEHPDRRIMILSDRELECNAIYEKLKGLGETNTLKLTGAAAEKKVCESQDCKTRPSFNIEGEDHGRFCTKHKLPDMVKIGSKKKINTTKYRVLVAGMKKAGIGFNDPTLTMLILATDRRDVIQFEGRIRTTNNIIYDLVDDYKTLESHWRQRLAWYTKRGALIETICQRPKKSKVPQHRMLKSNIKY